MNYKDSELLGGLLLMIVLFSRLMDNVACSGYIIHESQSLYIIIYAWKTTCKFGSPNVAIPVYYQFIIYVGSAICKLLG